MPEHNDDYYLCCLGVHVHTFTFIIALLVVIFWSVCIAGIIFSGEYIALLICIPPLFSYGCLLIGNRAGLPGNYCPFLIVNLTLIIGAFLFAGASYLTGAAFISHNFRIGSDTLETMLGSITVAVGTAAAIYAFFQFYYFYIVYRDYEYVKSQSAKKSSAKRTPRSNRQRRFYVDPKKLPKSSNEETKKFSLKVDDSDDENVDEKLLKKKKVKAMKVKDDDSDEEDKKLSKKKKTKSKKDKFAVKVEDSDDEELNKTLMNWNKMKNSKIKINESEEEELERLPKRKKTSKPIYHSYTNMQDEDLFDDLNIQHNNYDRNMWRSETDLFRPWKPNIGYSRWPSEQQLSEESDQFWRITSV